MRTYTAESGEIRPRPQRADEARFVDAINGLDDATDCVDTARLELDRIVTAIRPLLAEDQALLLRLVRKVDGALWDLQDALEDLQDRFSDPDERLRLLNRIAVEHVEKTEKAERRGKRRK